MAVIENSGDWFIAKVVLRFVPEGADEGSSSYTVWENLYLLRAEDISSAYDKAISIAEDECRGMSPCPDEAGGSGVWSVAGVSEVIPVFEDIEDGCELMWTNRGKMCSSDIKNLVMTKKQWIEARKPSA